MTNKPCYYSFWYLKIKVLVDWSRSQIDFNASEKKCDCIKQQFLTFTNTLNLTSFSELCSKPIFAQYNRK